MDIRGEAISTTKYIIIGFVLAVAINQGMGYALQTEKPIMAVVSNSMVPVFSKGDLIVVKGMDCRDVEVGDIIVYLNPIRQIPIVHRVVEIDDDDLSSPTFTTKGDNNGHTDQSTGISPPVRCDWVRGEVKVIVPKLGLFKVGLIELSRVVRSV